MGKSKQRNHTVPQVLLKNFAFTDPQNSHSFKLCVMDLKESDGGFRTTESLFYSNNFYAQDLEMEIGKTIENDLKRITNRMTSNHNHSKKPTTIKMNRKDVDYLRKMMLIQMIRTPSALKKITEIMKIDIDNNPRLFSEDIEDLEDVVGLWQGMINIAVKSDWNGMKNTDYTLIDNLASVFNCMSPILFRTDYDFIITDSGYFIETNNIQINNKRHAPADYQKAFGNHLSDVQLMRLMTCNHEYANFFGMPISRNYALLFVDDYWNARRKAIESHKNPSAILKSSLSGQLTGATIMYKSGLQWTYMYGYDSDSPHDEDDVFMIPIIPIPGRYTHIINCMSIENSDRIIAFHDLKNVTKTLDYYIKNGSNHDVSFYRSIHFNKDYKRDLSRKPDS